MDGNLQLYARNTHNRSLSYKHGTNHSGLSSAKKKTHSYTKNSKGQRKSGKDGQFYDIKSGAHVVFTLGGK